MDVVFLLLTVVLAGATIALVVGFARLGGSR